MKIQNLLAELTLNEKGYIKKVNRIETGVLRFNDDYPGVFIRGDNALIHYAYQIRQYLANPDYESGKIALENLLSLLESCDARKLHQDGKL